MKRAISENLHRSAPHSAAAVRRVILSVGAVTSLACGAPSPVRPCQCAAQSYARPALKQTSAGLPARTEAELLASYEGRAPADVLHGKATYYANSLAGNKTASGEVYDPQGFTAAHKKLPFGTVVRVVRKDTNRYVYVRITDRGPFAGRERIIDLSYVAAERLGMLRAGVVPVRVEVLQ